MDLHNALLRISLTRRRRGLTLDEIMKKKQIGIAVAILSILGACASVIALVLNQGSDSSIRSEGSQHSPNIIDKEEVNVVLTLSRSENEFSKDWDKLQYSFFRKEFIHPKIIQDMQGWISDTGDQVVSVNLLDANKSNRYSGKVEVRKIEGEDYPYVYCGGDQNSFGYRYIGTTDSGIHVLYTSEWGGGSGVFNRLIFLTFEEDEGIVYDYDKSAISTRARINLKSLGTIGLRDRYKGDLELKDGVLKIGKDVGWFSGRYESKDVYIRLQ